MEFTRLLTESYKLVISQVLVVCIGILDFSAFLNFSYSILSSLYDNELQFNVSLINNDIMVFFYTVPVLSKVIVKEIVPRNDCNDKWLYLFMPFRHSSLLTCYYCSNIFSSIDFR